MKILRRQRFLPTTSHLQFSKSTPTVAPRRECLGRKIRHVGQKSSEKRASIPHLIDIRCPLDGGSMDIPFEVPPEVRVEIFDQHESESLDNQDKIKE